VWAYWVNDLRSPADLTEAFSHAAFLVIVSLFVNRAVHGRQGAAHPPAAA